MVWVTPLLNSWRPLMRAARDGAHVGLTCNSVNRRLCFLKASTEGVFMMGLPRQA